MPGAAWLLTIGEFARRCGLSIRALRPYDRIGLLRPAALRRPVTLGRAGLDPRRDGPAGGAGGAVGRGGRAAVRGVPRQVYGYGADLDAASPGDPVCDVASPFRRA
ncbi:MerR family DNA-binding transcriptional regulator [Actinoplanes sp. NPDC049681]|uniref:MerR family DNA-binding transcriptional regulator n=1 Tax=Actinoplanes sp. NPDC049681 TaxID=3363905 RepID=UPI0037BB7354